MALTNAERQKRHRDRQKEALRKAEGGGGSLPVAYAECLRRDLEGANCEESDIPIRVALAMMEVQNTLGMDYADWWQDCPAMCLVFGGAEYLASLWSWELNYNIWKGTPKKLKGPRPEPPTLPVT